MKALDELVIEIYNVLQTPADSYKEIAERIECKVSQIGKGLEWIRENAEKLTWTVPHAPRGRSQPNRYFIVPVATDGYLRPFGAEKQATLQEGLAGTLRGINTTSKREATALSIALPYYLANDPIFAREIKAIHSTLNYCVEQTTVALDRLVG
jgi:hypothetical protein